MSIIFTEIMINYFAKCLIYIVIISSIQIFFSSSLKRYDTTERKKKSVIKWLAYNIILALIPFVRALICIFILILAFLPDKYVEQVKSEKEKKKEENQE